MTDMKAIIFDFDGVIHDTFDLARNVLIEAFGRELTREDFKDFFNGNVWDSWHVVTKEEDAKFTELQREAFKFLKADENIKRSLEKLHEQHSLFVVSSNYEDNLNTYFQNNNFIHIFKQILGAETHKSKIEKFKSIFQNHNLKVENCIFITDTLGDILEANKVGLKVIAVDFGFHEKERLEKGNPFKIVSDFDGILEVIDGM